MLAPDSGLAAVGLLTAVLAARGNPVALRVAAGRIAVITRTALPASFVDVPVMVRAVVAAAVLLTVTAVVLMLPGRPQVAD